MAHFKVGVDVLGDYVLGFGLILTVDNVHVKFSLVALKERAQVAHILAALFNGLQENAVGRENNVSFHLRHHFLIKKERDTDNLVFITLCASYKCSRRCRR